MNFCHFSYFCPFTTQKFLFKVFITKMLYKVTTALHLKQYLTDGQVRNQMSISQKLKLLPPSGTIPTNKAVVDQILTPFSQCLGILVQSMMINRYYHVSYQLPITTHYLMAVHTKLPRNNNKHFRWQLAAVVWSDNLSLMLLQVVREAFKKQLSNA